MTALPATPPPGYVRVRIAVATDADKNWGAHGHNDDSDFYAEYVAKNKMRLTPRISFITADVPMPDAPGEIVGVVS